VCMRNDRLSAYEQHDLPLDEALRRELAYGRASLAAGTLEGAAAFVAGKGRGGSFT
jgi:enoyl-CoA hydratase